MSTDNPTFKTVARAMERNRAEIIAAMLRDNGIPAAVFGADSSYPGLVFAGEITVKVNAEDYDAAISLVAAADRAE